MIRLCLLACLALGLMASPVSAQTAPPDPVAKLAATIDEQLGQRWQAEEITPASPADDAEYLRRVYLHIAGTTPPVSKVREFLADQSPDKRRKVVDELLETPGYVQNFTRYWSRVMIPETSADLQLRFLGPTFDSWLREKITANAPYDEIARELLNVELPDRNNSNRAQVNMYNNRTPMVFYQAKQGTPENLAAATARIFLGVRIECAQCHDHPFDTWKQHQFWEFAAFFSGLERVGDNPLGQIREIQDRREISIPGTEQIVQAAYLDGVTPQWKSRTSARTTLADWITDRQNPYFARAAVNRVWGHMFGRGIVEPVDDFSEQNAPSHPELLNVLAEAFRESGHDMKFLIRAITASKAYQLSSKQSHESQATPELFARMSVQGLTAEQLLNALSQATGTWRPQSANNNVFVFQAGNNPEGEFQQTFDDSGEAVTDRQTTILQALAMMNGPLVREATDIGQSKTLGAILESPFLSTDDKLDTMFLAVLSRFPTAAERSRMAEYVQAAGEPNHNRAYTDVFWALLNSSEFMLNH